MCDTCKDDTFPLSAEAAGIPKDELLDLEDNAAVDALNAIAEMCGVKEWDYPGQVVRDVRHLKETAKSVEDRNQRLMKAMEEAISRIEKNPEGAKSILEAGLRADMPYEPDRGRTHYDGCWHSRGHHNCAVQRIKDVHAENEMCRRVNQELRDQVQDLFKQLEGKKNEAS